MFENFRIAFDNLGSNKLRTALTMLGVTIGVAAVIILLSVGQSFETFVRQQFEGLGVNLIFVLPNFQLEDVQSLTLNDVEALANPARVPDALRVMPENQFNATLRFGTLEMDAAVEAVSPAYMGMFGRQMAAGRFFDEAEMEANARVAVIEQGVVDGLFPDSFPLGQAIRIDDVQFTIIGILSRTEGFFGFSDEDSILIPLSTAQSRLNNQRVISGEQAIDFIIVQGRDSDSAENLVAQIRLTLREVRNVGFRDEDDFLIISQNEIIDTLDEITGLLTVFLAILAGISLLVGGIGIMNIMLVTVTERTREIGLRKAVGAKKSDILLQFLTEAVILSLIGGAFGVLIALITSAIVSSLVPELTVIVQLSSVFLATLVSIAVGLFSGAYPANRAANLNPIDALRYE
jgi:putative ABC transport system permease protein